MPPCMPLEVLIFPKFVRTYETYMHHDQSFITYLHCSSPYKFLIWLSNSFLLYRCSHKSCTILLELMATSARSETFLEMFGTPTLLWRVLHYAGYTELPLYSWNVVYLEGQPWYELQQTIPARTQAPLW